MNEKRHVEVEGYISKITNCFNSGVVTNLLLNTCRGRFALDLCQRFHPAELMFSERENHFGSLIDGVVYDVCGNVTNRYGWEPWTAFAARKPKEADRIYHTVILLEDVA